MGSFAREGKLGLSSNRINEITRKQEIIKVHMYIAADTNIGACLSCFVHSLSSLRLAKDEEINSKYLIATCSRHFSRECKEKDTREKQ